MRLPVVRGLIDRRLLLNYRADPSVIQRILPLPFRPQLVGGYAIAGLCLIRLRQVRPKGFPAWAGVASENAAHRVAVEWLEGSELRSGVFILRRDTNSRLNVFAGGRIFPGVHHYSSFVVQETKEHVGVRFQHADCAATVQARVRENWDTRSVFSSLKCASDFFEQAPLGYSPGSRPDRFQGLELRCRSWRAAPLRIESLQSSFFDDERHFPRGSIQFDCGLIMCGIEHEWHTRADLCIATSVETAEPVLSTGC